MAKISGTARRPWIGNEGRVKQGDRFGDGERHPAIDERRAKVLVEKGLFLPDLGKEAARKASGRPLKNPLTGGRSGKAKQSSSSPADPASSKSTSTKSKDAGE